MKRVLLVTAKWPNPSDSIDGGDITISDLIQALGGDCQLDILCFRRSIGKTREIFNINRMFIIDEDFANYESYTNIKGEKFYIRFRQAEIAAAEIKKRERDYEIIIIQHCLFTLKFNKFDIQLLRKIVLLPMFTGTSYLKSNEYVPDEYILAEKGILRYIHKIITPSLAEAKTLLQDYEVNKNAIKIIPRPIKGIQYCERKQCSKNPKILYIGAIREQKAHFEAIKMMKYLLAKVDNVELHCVGVVQDKSIYQACINYCNLNGLENHIFFHGLMNHKLLCSYLQEMDINISVSYWETFGRGIFEGMAAGIPTIVLKRLDCVKSLPLSIQPLIVDDIQKLGDIIVELIQRPAFYQMEAEKGSCVQRYLSFDRISNLLKTEILQ